MRFYSAIWDDYSISKLNDASVLLGNYTVSLVGIIRIEQRSRPVLRGWFVPPPGVGLRRFDKERQFTFVVAHVIAQVCVVHRQKILSAAQLEGGTLAAPVRLQAGEQVTQGCRGAAHSALAHLEPQAARVILDGDADTGAECLGAGAQQHQCFLQCFAVAQQNA